MLLLPDVVHLELVKKKNQSVTVYFVLSVSFTMNIIYCIFCILTGCQKLLMMSSQMISQGQEVVECGLCQNPVSFFCRRCWLNLCDSCVPVHLRVKSEFGHDVVDYAIKDDDDVCLCDSHPENKCSAYCKKCDVPICILCVSIKHRSHEISELHDKVEDLLKEITGENDRLHSFRHKIKTLLDHTTKHLSLLSSIYQMKKDEVTVR